MRNQLAHLAILATIILFASCSKDPDSIVLNNNKVKSYTEELTFPGGGSTTTTLNINYDSNDRISSLVSSTSPGDKFVFTYISNDQYSMDLYTSGEVDLHEEFFLNHSLVDSTIQYSDGDSMSEKYHYNAANQLIKLVEYELYGGVYLSNVTNFTYDASGKMIKSTDLNGQEDTYEYYPDLVYAMPAIMPFFAAPPKMNLVKSHSTTIDGELIGSSTTTYTFDSSDRISTITETGDDGSISKKTFVY